MEVSKAEPSAPILSTKAMRAANALVEAATLPRDDRIARASQGRQRNGARLAQRQLNYSKPLAGSHRRSQHDSRHGLWLTHGSHRFVVGHQPSPVPVA